MGKEFALYVWRGGGGTTEDRYEGWLSDRAVCLPSHPKFAELNPQGGAQKVSSKFRLIHHLSYPKGKSVNDRIPAEMCFIKYTTLNQAMCMVRSCGQGAMLEKANVQSTFRLLQVHLDNFCLQGFQFKGKPYWSLCLDNSGFHLWAFHGLLAKKKAANSLFGTQLGWELMPTPTGLLLMPIFWNFVRDHGPPHVWLIHLGKNDLGCRTSISLRVQLGKDLGISGIELSA